MGPLCDPRGLGCGVSAKSGERRFRAGRAGRIRLRTFAAAAASRILQFRPRPGSAAAPQTHRERPRRDRLSSQLNRRFRPLRRRLRKPRRCPHRRSEGTTHSRSSRTDRRPWLLPQISRKALRDSVPRRSGALKPRGPRSLVRNGLAKDRAEPPALRRRFGGKMARLGNRRSFAKRKRSSMGGGRTRRQIPRSEVRRPRARRSVSEISSRPQRGDSPSDRCFERLAPSRGRSISGNLGPQESAGRFRLAPGARRERLRVEGLGRNVGP